jgi:hypothetical protein
MPFHFVAAQAIPTTASVDGLTRLTELVAAHGVYALLVFFLFYQQSKTLRAYLSASDQNRHYLRRNHQMAVWTTSVLMAVAIPIWIYSTFIYSPKTVIWGDVANLTQMSGVPQAYGQVVVEQQVLPEQSDVKFYIDQEPKKGDPSKITLNWALVEDGQYNQIPLVLYHRVKEWVNENVQLDPNKAAKPYLRDVTQKVKFVVQLGAWASGQQTSFDYQYDADATDQEHKVGTLRLLRNGKEEKVTLQELSLVETPLIRRFTWPGFSWLNPEAVFAQQRESPPDPAKVNRVLPLLGSRDIKQQQAAQETIKSAGTISWDAVRKVLDDPQATADHTALIHSLSEVVQSKQGKGVEVPADIRLRLAKGSYQVGDFKTSTRLFNELNDKELAKDVTNYYYRGVSNLQTGNYSSATTDLTKYVDKAPTPGAKAAGQRTLDVANQQGQGKK